MTLHPLTDEAGVCAGCGESYEAGHICGAYTEVWLAAGIKNKWRITSHNHTYAEFDDKGAALVFLSLLVEGNADRLKAKT